MTRTERTYYVITCLYRLSWSALGPTYAVFLIGRGLDILHVNLVLAVYLITTCIFEVPTGAIADIFGRKASFVASCVVRAAAFALYYFAHTFPVFLVAEFIDAIGTTLTTGALDAWAVDGVHQEGGRRPVEQMFARANILGPLTAILGGLAASQVAQHDIALPWLIGTAGFLLCGAVGAALMREPPRAPLPHSELPGYGPHALALVIRECVAAVRAMPVMRRLCGLTLVASFATVPVFQMWQPHMEALAGEGPWLLGWIWVGLNLAVMAGSALISRLVPRLGRGGSLSLSFAWRGVTLGAAALATAFMPALVGFLLQQLSFGFNEPVEQAWMNEYASSSRRATMLSLRSMAFTLGGATGLVCLGVVALYTSIATAWLVSACLYLVVARGYLGLGRLARRHEGGVDAPLRASA